jgi:hypothetical protein
MSAWGRGWCDRTAMQNEPGAWRAPGTKPKRMNFLIAGAETVGPSQFVRIDSDSRAVIDNCCTTHRGQQRLWVKFRRIRCLKIRTQRDGRPMCGGKFANPTRTRHEKPLSIGCRVEAIRPLLRRDRRKIHSVVADFQNTSPRLELPRSTFC